MNFLKSLFKKKERPEWVKGLKTGDIAIDCGANVGKITTLLAETGATVYAFEPNPHAFAELRKNTARFKNVTCLQKAVSDMPGKLLLFMHQNAEQDPVYWSTGSSLLSYKRNVNAENSVEVESVDLCSFIQELNKPVRLLKIDVEGAECAILKKMLDTGLTEQIGNIYVEMHDEKIPEIRESAEEIRRRIREKNLKHIDLTWI